MLGEWLETSGGVIKCFLPSALVQCEGIQGCRGSVKW